MGKKLSRQHVEIEITGIDNGEQTFRPYLISRVTSMVKIYFLKQGLQNFLCDLLKEKRARYSNQRS